VKVFTVRNLSDVTKNHIFKRFYEKSFHRCSIAVRVLTAPLFVNKPKRVWKNSSGYQDVYEDGMEMEMLKIIGYSLNLSLAIEPDTEETYCKSLPAIYVGGYKILPSMKIASKESLRNYLTIHSAWYTPCALKYPKLGRFFNIFSVHMWICFAFSLVLAVITVRCISNYAHETLLHESNSYSNIFSVIAIIIALSLSVSVNIQASVKWRGLVVPFLNSFFSFIGVGVTLEVRLRPS